MPQTYCVRADLASIVGEPFLLAAIDDDNNKVESASETLHITAAIERGAVEMNAALRHQYYPLTALADNDWCKWCNANLAIYHLSSRRGNPPPPSVADAILIARERLEEIRWGRDQVPDQLPTHEHIPTVSNFQPEIKRTFSPIRVDTDESTGASPGGGRKRNVSDMPGN